MYKNPGPWERAFESWFGGRRGSTVPETASSEHLKHHRAPWYVGHECGHLLLAWGSAFVYRIDDILVDLARGGYVMPYISHEATASYWDETALYLGGLAGEGTVVGKIRVRPSRDDLNRARQVAQVITDRYGRDSCPWRDQPVVTRLDIARLYSVGEVYRSPPDPETAAILNCCYRRAKNQIIEHRAVFDRFLLAVDRQRYLAGRDLEQLLGPRPWAVRPPRR